MKMTNMGRNRVGLNIVCCSLLALLAMFAGCSAGVPEGEPMATGTAVSGVMSTPNLSTATLTPTTASMPTMRIPAVPTVNTAGSVVIKATPASPASTVMTRFCCLRFSTIVGAQPRQVFAVGTEEIVALWDYSEMTPEDRIRRIWFRDDLIWLTREEKWDGEKYGAEGTVTDIAIYDNEGTGLLPARYRLQLYVNDQLEQEGTFVIEGP